MRVTLLAFVAGCWWLQQQAQLPPWQYFAALSVVALLLRRDHPRVFVIVVALTLGAGWSTWRSSQRLADWLPEAQAGQNIELSGVIAGLPDVTPHGTRFLFAPDRDAPRRVLLTWREPLVGLSPGQRWQFTVRLRRPRGLANPHGFDHAYWLLSEGIGATGYVRAARDGPVRVDDFPIEQRRAELRARLQRAMPADARFGPVLIALVIGDQRGIAQADWEVFRRTGISHLVSISGLHITMISGAVGGVVHWLWRHSFGFGRRMRRPLPLWWPARQAALVVAVLTALAYSMIAGMQIPALRTVTMLTVAALALWSSRTPPPSLVLAWAAAVAVAIDPWAVMSAGFWLSFGAVAVIFLAAVRERDGETPRWRAMLMEAARTQWAVTIGLVPLTLLLFGQVSVVSALANIVAIPLVSVVVAPLALFAAVLPAWLAQLALTVAHASFAWLAELLAILAAPQWAVWEAPHPGVVATALAISGVYLVLAPRTDVWLRWGGVLLMLPMLLASRDPVPHGELRVTALDVGQGTAVLVETRNRALLYDTGPAYSSGTSAGAQVVVPFLRATGVTHLDVLMVSHEDADHAGGVRDVEAAVPIDTRLTAAPDGQQWMRESWRPCVAGGQWEWDGVRFEILHPTEAQAGNSRYASNARSCVLRVATANRSVLLTGDIGVAEEREMVARDPDAVRSDILVVPHHGSGTSSGLAFLRAAQPEVAIFQLGHANRYRHPRADVWARYASTGIARYRTDETGAISIVTRGAGYDVSPYRQRERRYWREAPPAPR